MRDPKLRFLMTPANRVRYLAWRLAPLTSAITVLLKSGEKLCLRHLPSTDSGVAYEVFAKDMYRGPQPPDHASVKRIVDLGANVGFSFVYWAYRYPAARIDAYEPHPVHLAALETHLKINRIQSRVAVHPVAVGTSAGTAWLSDEQASSHIGKSDGNGFTVRVVDFFESVGAGRIDLLKMDIEGGEYSIFMDERFAGLNLGSIAFEWHNYPPHPDADKQIFERLRLLGWRTVSGAQGIDARGRIGIGYAYARG